MEYREQLFLTLLNLYYQGTRIYLENELFLTFKLNLQQQGTNLEIPMSELSAHHLVPLAVVHIFQAQSGQ